MTAFAGVISQAYNPPRPTQPPTLSRMGNVYRPKHNIGLRSEQLFNYQKHKTKLNLDRIRSL